MGTNCAVCKFSVCIDYVNRPTQLVGGKTSKEFFQVREGGHVPSMSPLILGMRLPSRKEATSVTGSASFFGRIHRRSHVDAMRT